MPGWLQNHLGGWGWGNRPDASFLHFHLFFLEVRKCPLSQTVQRPRWCQVEFWRHGKTRQILLIEKFKQESLLLLYCFQNQHHFLAQLLASVINTVFVSTLGFVISYKSCVAKKSKRVSAPAPHLPLFYRHACASGWLRRRNSNISSQTHKHHIIFSKQNMMSYFQSFYQILHRSTVSFDNHSDTKINDAKTSIGEAHSEDT